MNTKTIVALLLAAALPLLAADAPALPATVKSIYNDYLKIQSALADDSMKGVAQCAASMAKLAQADETKSLPSVLSKQATTLAEASDLKSAREAFKPVSNSLIKYLADNKVPKGTYYEVYCPMAQASWLQTNKTVNNPYMGKEMATCGEVKE